MIPISGHTPVYALLGHPVAHSGSPALHNGWFAAHGIDGVYVALDVDPALGPRLVDALRVLPLAGANLTVPFKEAVVGSLDRLDGRAHAAGVVNTLVRESDGSWTGHNTDGDGFVDGITEAGHPPVEGERAVILGAGGAGRGIAAGLVARGMDVVLLNRTLARAERAADALRGLRSGASVQAGALDADTFRAVVSDAALVVQATAGPGAALVARFEVGAVPRSALWVDINYWMDAPPCWEALAQRGIARQDGRPMLRRQAARAFRLWTGVDPEPLRATTRVR